MDAVAESGRNPASKAYSFGTEIQDSKNLKSGRFQISTISIPGIGRGRPGSVQRAPIFERNRAISKLVFVCYMDGPFLPMTSFFLGYFCYNSEANL